MNQGGRFLILFFVLSLFSFPSVWAAEPQAAAPAEDSQEEVFVARKVEKQAEGEAGDQAEDNEPNFIVEGGKVISNPRKAAGTANAASAASIPAVPVSVDSEPNFIVEGGKVIPNPRKAAGTVNAASVASMPAGAGSGDNEPNFISVNGRVIPNPNKSKAA